jgi:hypothetical protein
LIGRKLRLNKLLQPRIFEKFNSIKKLLNRKECKYECIKNCSRNVNQKRNYKHILLFYSFPMGFVPKIADTNNAKSEVRLKF